jgi:hypothetical protein
MKINDPEYKRSNCIINGIISKLSNGKLIFYSGPIPYNCDSYFSWGNQRLGHFNFLKVPAPPAEKGVISFYGFPMKTYIYGSGVISFARCYDSSEQTPVAQLSVGAYRSGCDILFSNTTAKAGDEISLQSLNMRFLM